MTRFERITTALLGLAAASLLYLANAEYQERRFLRAAIEHAKREQAVLLEEQAVLLEERCAVAVGGILGIRAELDGELDDEITLPILRNGCGPDAKIEDYPELAP